jgi:hypothetical protein
VPGKNEPVLHQRWMLYPIYVAAGLVCLDTMLFLATLNDTREFIGEQGIECCWSYTSFERYLFASLTSIGVALVVLTGLYWLARRNDLLTYLILWVVWLLEKALLLYFEFNFS